ncbi:hypothetical protein M1N58_00330 [Dehalococcoidales bacterium]|nr:hypothetical protein [Dehalococcoidales bacterium]
MVDRIQDIPYEVAILGDAGTVPLLEDIASWLRHLVYLHDRLVLLTSPQYRYAASSFYFFQRSGRPLRETELLKVRYVRQGSPIEIAIIIGAAIGFPAAKAFIEFIKMIRDWQLDKEYKALSNEDLRLEIKRKVRELGMSNQFPPNLADDKTREQPIEMIAKDVRRILKDEILVKEVKVIETTKGKGSSLN